MFSEVDPLAYPTCAGPMRIVAFIMQAAVIDHILTHLRTRTASGDRPGARSLPSTLSPAPGGDDLRRGGPVPLRREQTAEEPHPITLGDHLQRPGEAWSVAPYFSGPD